mgnify:CR=1 FL=1|jgi:hypothetical protein|tara:strand:- start:8536 stop:9198 length:663 start_codon:yes stop_codon:yes gene_type:complete
MLTSIIGTTGTASYNEPLLNNVLSNSNLGIENILNFSQYNSLEKQLNQIQTAEPEDPPETIHTPWGVWRHWRDALHSIDEKYDAEHAVRTGRAAEDILHQAHYVPVIGDYVHAEESYEINLEYTDSDQLEVYNIRINLEEYHPSIDFEEEIEGENTETSVNTEIEDDSTDLKDKNIDEEPKDSNSAEDKVPEKNFDLESEKELTEIFEKVLKFDIVKFFY